MPGKGLFAQETEGSKIIIVLDASGSMRSRIKGETKMTIAKQTVGDLVASLPDEAEVGLVVYGHRKGAD
ncbi:MAG: VWA domain-containing protein, partial [Verrucomicrobiae bacterium]|nr:VWA domain-containing protein [Verrucomicrobiae bacterium]